MPAGRKLLSKWIAGAFEQIAGTGVVSSLTGLDVASEATIERLTGTARWTGVDTLGDGDTIITVSAAGINTDRPILIAPLAPSNASSTPMLSVDSVVAGISFAVVAQTAVHSAVPVSWVVVR